MNTAEKPLADLMGNDLVVPVFGGGTRRYVNLDNAATTPVLKRAWDRLAAVMPWYGSVHRGDGLKSAESTRVLEEAWKRIFRFSDGCDGVDTIVFGPNTTSCINHLARRMNLTRDSVVIMSELEHSSNVLPWRKHSSVMSCRTLDNGEPDLDDLAAKLKETRARLVAVTAASSITGAVLDVHRIARVAHEYGARVFVDAAQFVGHRKLDRRPPGAPDHLDYVAYAGHKMYAPFGAAVLVGPEETFSSGWPDQPGGGTVKLIDGDDVVWAAMPEREQGGTPNFPGVVSLATACEVLDEIGFDKIQAHERALLAHTKHVLDKLDAVTTFGQPDLPGRDRVAVVPFAVTNYHHTLVSAYLGAERGIGVRSGPICQYELVARLLNVSKEERSKARRVVEAGDLRKLYGIVRASFGLGSCLADVDELGAALKDLIEKGPAAPYEQQLDGKHRPVGWEPGCVQPCAAARP